MNFDKLMAGVSTVPGALGLVATLGIGVALIWVLKHDGFGGPDNSLVEVLKDMIAAQRENTKAVKENSGHVQKQLAQFQDSNQTIKSMVGPLENIEMNSAKIASEIHDEVIRKEATR